MVNTQTLPDFCLYCQYLVFLICFLLSFSGIVNSFSCQLANFWLPRSPVVSHSFLTYSRLYPIHFYFILTYSTAIPCLFFISWPFIAFFQLIYCPTIFHLLNLFGIHVHQFFPTKSFHPIHSPVFPMCLPFSILSPPVFPQDACRW